MVRSLRQHPRPQRNNRLDSGRRSAGRLWLEWPRTSVRPLWRASLQRTPYGRKAICRSLPFPSFKICRERSFLRTGIHLKQSDNDYQGADVIFRPLFCCSTNKFMTERDLKILAAVTVMMVSYYALAGEMHRNILNLLNRRREDKWQ